MGMQTNGPGGISGFNAISSYQSIQKGRPRAPQQFQEEIDPQSQALNVQDATVESPSPKLDVQPDQRYRQLYQDVRQVAEKAGFVGLTQKDIMRAYTTGSSLLADYHA